jgi:hypothetical protein
MKQIIKNILAVLAVILLSTSCATYGSEKSREEEMISVAYLVYAPREVETISATYTNPDGGTEQITGMTPTIGEDDDIRMFTVAHYEKFPKDEFLYLSVQNESDRGFMIISIMVNRESWKSAKSEGGYTIATVSGYY